MRAVCPPPAAIASIPAQACDFSLDQIVRIVFQRRQATSTFLSTGTTPKPITALSSWTPLLTAADSTKVQPTPLFDSLTIPPSEGQEEGGNDNSTIFGIPIDLGDTSIKVTGQHRNLESAVKAALDKYRSESQASKGASSLTVYLINRFGDIFHLSDKAGDPVGIPVYNYRLSSRGSEGFNQSDKVPFSFYLEPGWDQALKSTKPAFNPIVEL